MTPAAQTIYIDTATGAWRSTLTGGPLPSVNLILLTGGRLNFSFVSDGVVVAPSVGTTGKLVIKAALDAAGSPLVLDSAWDVADSVYSFKSLVDSAALRAALVGFDFLYATAQLFWDDPNDEQPSSSLPHTVKITNNYNRIDDTAPVISADYSLVLNGAETAVEVFKNGVSKGFAHLHTTAP